MSWDRNEEKIQQGAAWMAMEAALLAGDVSEKLSELEKASPQGDNIQALEEATNCDYYVVAAAFGMMLKAALDDMGKGDALSGKDIEGLARTFGTFGLGLAAVLIDNKKEESE